MKQIYLAIQNFGKTAVFILLGFIVFSCVSTRSMTIEIPEKAKHELPDSIQSLVLITRVFDNSFSDLTTDSLQKLFYLRRFNYDTVLYDTRSIDTTLKAIGELIFESGRYDFVIPAERLQIAGEIGRMAPQMAPDEVKDWCSVYNTDAVLSIDYFKTRVMTSYDNLVNFDQQTNGFYDFAHAEMQIGYESLFRIYEREKGYVIYRKVLSDTIMWESSDRTASALFSNFTPVKDALAEAGIAMALDIAEDIGPAWRTESRKYFISGDDNLKRSVALVDNNQWETAIATWKNIAQNSHKKSVKSKAEFNVAVGYEITGDLDSAIEWGLKSFETMYRTQTYDYLEVLKNRKIELQQK